MEGIEPAPGKIDNDPIYDREDTHRPGRDPAGASVRWPRQLDMEKQRATLRPHVGAEHPDNRAVSVCVPWSKSSAAADGYAAEDKRSVGACGRRAEVVASDLGDQKMPRNQERCGMVRSVRMRLHPLCRRATGREEHASSRCREDEHQQPHEDPHTQTFSADASPSVLMCRRWRSI